MNIIKNAKLKEESFLTNSKQEMRSKMDKILDKQLREIENEKNTFNIKYNISYYIEKAENLKRKNEALKNEKRILIEEYDHYKGIIAEREKRLYLEVRINIATYLIDLILLNLINILT